MHREKKTEIERKNYIIQGERIDKEQGREREHSKEKKNEGEKSGMKEKREEWTKKVKTI